MHAIRTTLVELGSHHSTDVGRELFRAPGAPNMSQRNGYLLHRSQAYCQLGRENNLLGYLGDATTRILRKMQPHMSIGFEHLYLKDEGGLHIKYTHF